MFDAGEPAALLSNEAETRVELHCTWCTFSVDRTTASRHFRAVLTTLTAATARWSFRPPFSIMRAMLPECIEAHYLKFKMNIDSNEVRTETPNSVGQQRVLYSSYVSGYTLKFLVAIPLMGLFVSVQWRTEADAPTSILRWTLGSETLCSPGT